jgi:hypothetical protein
MALPTGKIEAKSSYVTPLPSPLFPNTCAGTSFRLPVLAVLAELETHVRLCLGILMEMGLFVYGDVPSEYYHRVCGMLLESLVNFPNVRAEAESMWKDFVSFSAITVNLVETFFDRREMAHYVEREMAELELSRPCTEFLSKVRRLYRLSSRVYKRSPDRFVDGVMGKLPAKVRIKLAHKLRELDPLEWKAALPIDSTNPQEHTFLSVLSALLKKNEVEEEVNAMFAEAPRVTPRVAGVAEESTVPRARGWLEPWVKSYAVVYKCTGDCRGELQDLNAKYKDETKFSVRFISGRNGREGYALVGINGTSPQLRCKHRPFVLQSMTKN